MPPSSAPPPVRRPEGRVSRLRIHPHVRASLAVAALAALGGAWPPRDLVVRVERSEPTPSPSGESPATLPSVCPPRTVPDGEVCVPSDGATATEGPELTEHRNSHHDRHGRLTSYDQIPRRPDRPASHEAYVFPVEARDGRPMAISGFDLDRPDDEQRRGPGLKAVGHGGIDLAAPRGAEVRSLALEHQEGDAEVLHVGPLFGTSVVTRHALREGGRLRDYLVIHGHLDDAAEGLAKGARVRAGDLLGHVGDTGSEGLVHLHLEVRRAREGVDLGALEAGRLTANDRTVAVDPRNVLPLR